MEADPVRSLLQGNSPLADAQLKVALARLRTEVARRMKATATPEGTAFFNSVVRAVGRIRGSANVDSRIACVYDSGYFLYNNGRTSEVLQAVSCLDTLARRTRDSSWARRIDMLAGVAHAEVGNVAEAIVRYSAALKRAQRDADAVGEVSTLCNIGATLNYAALFEEAASCLERTIALSRSIEISKRERALKLSPRHFECVALTNLAQSYYYLGRQQEALAAITKCLDHSPTPSDSVGATNQIVREFTFIRIALDLGLRDQALLHTSHCESLAAIAGARGRILTSICLGLCEAYFGDIERGISKLEDALSLSEDGQSTRMAALLALAKAAERIDDPMRALAYLGRLLDQMRQQREQGVMALLSNEQTNYYGMVVPERHDLREIRSVEAGLRAKAAERSAVAAHLETLERLAIAADVKDEPSGGHGHRVGRLSCLFALDLGWPKDQCHALELAGKLHDIGKIALPDRLLLKSQILRDAEHKFISIHTTVGAEMLSHSAAEPLQLARSVALFHHEWWNGLGYPRQFAGEAIPVCARVIALADVFDALTHGRPYSTPWPFEQAVAEIKNRVGTQFDPKLGSRFVEFVDHLHSRHPDLDSYLGHSAQQTVFSKARERIQVLLNDAERAMNADGPSEGLTRPPQTS